MKKSLILIFLVCCILISSCNRAVEGKEESINSFETKQASVVITTNDENLVEEMAPDLLPFVIEFNTQAYASIGFELAKGETFSARIYLSDDLIFYILNSNRYCIFDAGRINGIYEFTLTSNSSGIYIMNFKDDPGDYIEIELYHNYLGVFWDYSR